VAANADPSPDSLRHYRKTLAQVLDFAEVTPNPAKDRRLKLPTTAKAEPVPPTGDEWRQIKERLSDRHLLVARIFEATGLRIGELCALTWGDVDFASGRLRISVGRTKGQTSGSGGCRFRRNYSTRSRSYCRSRTGDASGSSSREAVAASAALSATPASSPESCTTILTTSVTGGSRSGSPRASIGSRSPTGPATRSRRCRATSTATSSSAKTSGSASGPTRERAFESPSALLVCTRCALGGARRDKTPAQSGYAHFPEEVRTRVAVRVCGRLGPARAHRDHPGRLTDDKRRPAFTSNPSG
jgi:hypothetical protein